MYRLVFLTGARKGRRLAVQQGTLLIGRDHDVQLDLREDEEVSRHHATIEQRADGYYLTDLGGTNPVEVNGQKVRGVIKLQPDDQIEIGRTLMQFQVVETAVASTRRTAGLLQVATFSLMGLLLLAQVAYWFLFPRLQQAPLLPEPPPAPVDPLVQDLERALAAATADEPAPRLPLPKDPIRPPAAATGEVQDLRIAVAEMRRQVENLAAAATNLPPAQPDSNTLAAAAAAQAAASNAAAQAATQLTQAKTRLAEALALEQRGDLAAADQALERLQAQVPDFVPAYVERARIFEKRGLLTQAGEQWTQVLNRSTGTPLYDQAATQRQRLARAEIIQALERPTPAPAATTGSVPAVVAATPAPQLPGLIHIATLNRDKFEASRDYDEMRVVHAELRPHPGLGLVEVDEVAVQVTFYDRDTRTGQVHPTRAVAPREPFRIEGVWRANETKTVTAADVVARDFRRDEAAREGGPSEYAGVRVSVFYKGRLQDEDAVPKDLLKQPAPAAPVRPARVPARATPQAEEDPNAPVAI